jgi:phage terminase small subunit
MTIRGRRPKPSHLRLVDGTHRSDRHGDASKALSDAAAAFGPLRMPSYFKRQARVAWQRYITPASWLDASREPAAIAFCELWQELRLAPASFQAAKHSQLRAYMADLGLTDERNRTVEAANAKDEFFDD